MILCTFKKHCVSICACVHDPLEYLCVPGPTTQEETFRVDSGIGSKVSYGFYLEEYKSGDGRRLV